MDFNDLEPIIISLLFASGDALQLEVLANILEKDKDILRVDMDCFVEVFSKRNNGMIIKKINDSYQLASDPKNKQYTDKLFEPRQRQNLSQASLEVLSIIAYNQGITRAEIEKIRGVYSDNGLNTLLERNLIKDAGRLDAPGRPITYETTDEFLKTFGIDSLEDLPNIDIPDEGEVGINDD